MMYGYGWSWGWMLAMVVLMVLVIAGLVIAVVFVGRGRSHAASVGNPTASQSSAQGILEERFARGEIDEEEFRRRSETLRR